MKELKLYEISEEYIAYISAMEKYVFSAKKDNRNHTRKYLGIVHSIHAYHYYIPLSSPKIPITGLKTEYGKFAEALSPSSALLPNLRPEN